MPGAEPDAGHVVRRSLPRGCRHPGPAGPVLLREPRLERPHGERGGLPAGPQRAPADPDREPGAPLGPGRRGGGRADRPAARRGDGLRPRRGGPPGLRDLQQLCGVRCGAGHPGGADPAAARRRRVPDPDAEERPGRGGGVPGAGHAPRSRRPVLPRHGARRYQRPEAQGGARAALLPRPRQHRAVPGGLERAAPAGQRPLRPDWCGAAGPGPAPGEPGAPSPPALPGRARRARAPLPPDPVLRGPGRPGGSVPVPRAGGQQAPGVPAAAGRPAPVHRSGTPPARPREHGPQRPGGRGPRGSR